MNTAFGPMTMLLIVWACATLALGLAFLSVVVRHAQRRHALSVAEQASAPRPETAPGLEVAKPACHHLAYQPLLPLLPSRATPAAPFPQPAPLANPLHSRLAARALD